MIRSIFGLRRRNRLTVAAGVILVIISYQQYFLPCRHNIVSQSQKAVVPPCPLSPLAHEILLVVRTGVTEALSKLPVHFNTTFQCIPDYIIYSDYSEVIENHQIYDVLDEVSESLKNSTPEFRLYEHFLTHGRADLDSTLHLGSGPSGSLDNPAWKLDRFKFLPMVDKALRHRPNAKWFVFIEADTYLVWQNLLQYLDQFDASKDFYIGKHMFIGDVLFAHGGSGFIISNPAMRKVTERRNTNLAEYDEYTASSWAGDMVLGKALKDVDIPLFWAWPHFQGDPISSLDQNVAKVERKPWCYAPITYHHMHSEEIHDLWLFEQTRQLQGPSELLHRDMFKEYILPKLVPRIENWDNLCMDPTPNVQDSREKCHRACETDGSCLQYSYAGGRCSKSSAVRYGNQANSQCLEYSVAASKCVRWQDEIYGGGGIQSGWMVERLARYVEDMDRECHGEVHDAWVI